MSAYRTSQPPEPERKEPQHGSDVVLYAVGVLVAMLPFVVLVASGSADPLDLGVATILLIFLVSSFVGRWRSNKPEHPREERH